MTDPRVSAVLERLLALHEVATPGPWREGIDGNLRAYAPDGLGLDSGSVLQAFSRKNLSVTVASRNALPALLLCAKALVNLRADTGEIDYQQMKDEADDALEALAGLMEEEGKS